MSFKKNRFLFSAFLFAIVGSAILFVWDNFSFYPSPHFLKYIVLESLWLAFPDEIVVTKEGKAYVNTTNYKTPVHTSSIVVLDGTEIETIIPWPAPEFETKVKFAYLPATNQIYVTSPKTDAVRVISGTEFVAQISGIHDATAIAANPVNHYVYTLNNTYVPDPHTGLSKSAGTVAIISSTTVITQFPMYHPTVVKVDPIRGYTYIGQDNYGEADFANAPFLMMLSGTEIITYTALGSTVGGRVLDLEVNEKNGAVYLIDQGYLIYWERDKEISRIESRCANDLIVDSKRNYVYMTHCGRPNISVWNKDKLLAQFDTAPMSTRMAIDRVRDYVYVGNVDGSMSILHGTELITTTSFTLFDAHHLAVDEKRGYVYLSTDNAGIGVFGYEDADAPFWFRFLPFIQR